MSRTAVILFNLGGPDSPAAIKPFLFNFFTDKNIVRLPYPFRFLLAKIIAYRRSKREAGDSYGLLGGFSPLLANTQAQADALQTKLGDAYKVFVCMRYWHPMADAVAAAVKTYAPDKIVLLPLYPQYSTTTTRSSNQAWQRAAEKINLKVPTTLLCCYPRDSGFVTASADLIRSRYLEAAATAAAQNLPPPRILFSAHGLPESIIRDGDPYQWQCEESACAIVAALDIPNLDWRISYQSRVGRQKWIGPATSDEITRAGAEKTPLVIYPVAFTQEHVETLAELDIEYRHVAEAAGVPIYARVPTVGVVPTFIDGLADMVQRMNGDAVESNEQQRLCPATCRRCAYQET